MVAAHEARRNVAISWKNGEVYLQNHNFLTTGKEVLSYGHIIGQTDLDGKKVLYDCHASRTTTGHVNVLRSFADRIEMCAEHPRHVTRVKYTGKSTSVIHAGAVASSQFLLREASQYRVGIQDAIVALLDTACTVSLQPGVINICDGPDNPIDMLTCSKCWVIVGLRNVLRGVPFDAKPTT